MPPSPGSSGEKALHAAIQSRSFAPVYYLHGEDAYRINDALQQLLAAAVDPVTRDFNLELRRGAELDAEALGSLLATPPMMAERRVVVVRDVTLLRKDTRAALVQYLERPAPDTVLVLTSAPDATPDKLLLARTTAVRLESLDGARLERWIAHHARTKLDCEITPSASALLRDAAGTDLGELEVELEKLASHASGAGRALIEDGDVSAVVGVRRDETLGVLLDAVGRRDAAAAFELVPHILQQPRISAVNVVMALAAQLLAVGWARARRAQGLPLNRIAPEIFALLKRSGSVYTGRSWGEAASAWLKQLDAWDAAALDAGLEALLAADAALKETRLSSDEQLISTLVLTLCGAGEE
ncbi:MAG TPA: DNA polymerase III subunit delta, partial [Gemmatimonadaceae bacterium]|nr:DNA polymerase III subunit delta [Gemmatimonadaceae bacterium]